MIPSNLLARHTDRHNTDTCTRTDTHNTHMDACTCTHATHTDRQTETRYMSCTHMHAHAHTRARTHTHKHRHAHTQCAHCKLQFNAYRVSKELWFLKARFMGAWPHAADVIKCEENVMFCSQLCWQFNLNLIVILWVPVHYTSYWWIT